MATKHAAGRAGKHGGQPRAGKPPQDKCIAMLHLYAKVIRDVQNKKAAIFALHSMIVGFVWAVEAIGGKFADRLKAFGDKAEELRDAMVDHPVAPKVSGELIAEIAGLDEPYRGLRAMELNKQLRDWNEMQKLYWTDARALSDKVYHTAVEFYDELHMEGSRWHPHPRMRITHIRELAYRMHNTDRKMWPRPPKSYCMG
jgi:hypothetical protein